MFCDQCGSAISNSASFCSKCGRGIGQAKEKSDVVNPDSIDNIQKNESTYTISLKERISKIKWPLIALLVGLLGCGWWYTSRPSMEKGIVAYEQNNFETAYKNILPFAEDGDAKAQRYIGVMSLEGQWVEKNSKKAVFWFTKAAEKGDRKSQYGLGLMYSSGMEGIVVDDAQAIAWFTKAADQGHADAQYALDTLYGDYQRERKLSGYSEQSDPRIVQAGMTYFAPIGKLNCDLPSEDAQCDQLMKEVVPNVQECDTSMASGGTISWGRRYNTASGKPISLLLRKGRGLYLEFIPSDSSSCSALPITPICPANAEYGTVSSACFGGKDTSLSVASYGTGENDESSSGDESFIALMVKGDTIFYASENSVSWDSEANVYRYYRGVYKITSNGAEELYRQKVENKQLIKLDEALPLRADLTPF